MPLPIPRGAAGSGYNREALQDIDRKFFNKKSIPAHGQGGGFLYIHIPAENIRGYLSRARVYIPHLYREDNGTALMFFEIDLKPAIDASPGSK